MRARDVWVEWGVISRPVWPITTSSLNAMSDDRMTHISWEELFEHAPSVDQGTIERRLEQLRNE